MTPQSFLRLSSLASWVVAATNRVLTEALHHLEERVEPREKCCFFAQNRHFSAILYVEIDGLYLPIAN